MDKYKYALLIFSFSWIFMSCETDIDTTAEWKDISVVYGLFDQRDSVQYIKINKAFLGEGDALLFAKENDSINYPFPLNVWVEEWDENGDKVQTIKFDTTTTYKPNDPNAVFSTGAQRIYKGILDTIYGYRPIIEGDQVVGSRPIWLKDKSNYKLFIQYPDSSKVITSETILVQHFEITKPGFLVKNIKFVPNPSQTTFSWNKAPNDDDKFKYEFLLIFNYQELTYDNQVRNKELILATGDVYPQVGVPELFYNYLSYNFFPVCTDNIPYDDPAEEDQIKERHTGLLDIFVSCAASEFSLFMQVYEPSTSIIQEKPPYTNITNGIGLFSARYKTYVSKYLHDETITNLKNISVLKFNK